jgi:hypothetical protein
MTARDVEEDTMDRPRKLAVVEFRHGRGCSTGQPYGRCEDDCDWKVVKFVSGKEMTREEQIAHGVQPEEMHF